jgi:hypothetical protein
MGVRTNIFVTRMKQYTIFFSCYFACILWGNVHVAFNMPLPASITNIFQNGLTAVSGRVGCVLSCWTIWDVATKLCLLHNGFVCSPRVKCIR